MEEEVRLEAEGMAMIHCTTDSLMGDSAVTRAPAGGLWADMVPEVGTRGGMANPGPGARLAS